MGNGEQMIGMVSGLGSVSGCPHIPVATSARCEWTKVHTGVVSICSDQPVSDRCVVFDFVTWWKEGFMSMLSQSYIRAALMMGVFSGVCSGVPWGRGGLQCRILGGVIVSFFGWVVSGMGREGVSTHEVQVVFTS